MNYSESLDFLYSRLPMFSRTGPAAIKPDLTNTRTICSWLGNPQDHFRCIHIAGTNGKGSCSHMLAAILQQCGYKTGLYTSPHLKDFRERIRINGEMITQDFVVEFTAKSHEIINNVQPSFFELSVGMAFDYFARNNIDVAVIETGLGGRLDSTNIVTPELSVITNIGLDHMNLLGDTRELIAFEKAGIIKDGVTVVIGESSLETDDVFMEVAVQRRAPIVFADKKWHVADWNHQHGYLETDVVNKHDESRSRYSLDLPGYYQLKNLVTVVEAVHQLKAAGWNLPAGEVSKALKQVKKLTGLHGRWETIHSNPEVVLDVAHNADGIRQLIRQVELSDYHSLHIVFGMVKDKEIDAVLDLLPTSATYYFTKADIPRALPEDILKTRANDKGLEGNAFPDVNKALKAAVANASSRDLILVCGSVFVVGEVIPF